MATKRQQSQNPAPKKTRQINEILLLAETLDNFYVFFSLFLFCPWWSREDSKTKNIESERKDPTFPPLTLRDLSTAQSDKSGLYVNQAFVVYLVPSREQILKLAAFAGHVAVLILISEGNDLLKQKH